MYGLLGARPPRWGNARERGRLGAGVRTRTNIPFANRLLQCLRRVLAAWHRRWLTFASHHRSHDIGPLHSNPATSI
jgi:hypothetical protein